MRRTLDTTSKCEWYGWK